LIICSLGTVPISDAKGVSDPQSLKRTLDRLLESHKEQFLESDPLAFVRKYDKSRDQEIAAFVGSCFAIGRADLIRNAVRTVLERMGPSPGAFVSDSDSRQFRTIYRDFVYRFFRGRDVAVLLSGLQKAVKRHGSLESFFLEGYDDEDSDVGRALSRFVRGFVRFQGRAVLKPGLRAFLSDPYTGSGCKRLCLFLRWMVRREYPDLGVWKSVSPAKLVIPLDTHVIRLGKKLGLTKRVSPGWKMALEITESLRRLDPDDPVRYDFALCHAGMRQTCPKDGDEGCESCVFGTCCVKRQSTISGS
jgi:uncharacterized protein (TIGR02757 family)